MSTPGIAFYLHVHQPYRVRPYTVFDTGNSHDYFSSSSYTSQTHNEAQFRKVADKSYRPMNALLETLLAEHPEFRFSLSITGTFIEQAEQWAPDVLESFRRLVGTGRVSIVAETYYHSLAFYYSRAEFERQVELHRYKIRELFGVTPSVFRNTELAYDDAVGAWAADAGYKGVLAEGWDPVLEWRSPHYVYSPVARPQTGLLLKDYRLSDDIAFRFSNQSWNEWPLTSARYADWVQQSLDTGPLANIFMDYETFGEHQWADTGIFGFFETFVDEWLKRGKAFYTVEDALVAFSPEAELPVPSTVTWADSERDLSAWDGNSMQREATRYIYALERDVLRTGDEQLIQDWRRLTSSDSTYYMSTKWLDDGEVHAYFSPYDSPYDAFLYYINVIRDLRWRLMQDHRTGHLHG
ncbi:MAG: glycoside hydrolase family 57 protein [Candidatus Saccharimonadales bacterium]